MDVEVIRSSRRRKTIEARLVEGTLEVRVPARLSRREEDQCVRDMVERFERRQHADRVDVQARAAALARRYDLPVPASVRWVDNQRRRWGSCTIETGEIRVSSALASYPRWVLDYVLVHEMAHLVEADHGAGFRALVARYPKAERAEGFLIAKGHQEADEGEDDTQAEPEGAEKVAAGRVAAGRVAAGRVAAGRVGSRSPSGAPRLAGGAVQPSLF